MKIFISRILIRYDSHFDLLKFIGQKELISFRNILNFVYFGMLYLLQ